MQRSVMRMEERLATDKRKRKATAACDSAPSKPDGALFMENSIDWRTESRTAYSNEFKLRIVELASQPRANVIAGYAVVKEIQSSNLSNLRLDKFGKVNNMLNNRKKSSTPFAKISTSIPTTTGMLSAKYSHVGIMTTCVTP